MVKRRPHTLRATVTGAAPPYQDADGNTVIPTGAAAEITAPCRAERATADGRRAVRDGTAYDYGWTVFTGRGLPALPIGTEVEVTDAATGETFGRGRVAAHERGQRSARVWLV